VAHCFDYLTDIPGYNNDPLDSNPGGCGFGHNCGYLGSSQNHIYGDPTTGWDDALMSGATSFNDLTWENTLPYNPPTTLNGYTNPQQSFSHSVLGEHVCSDGAFEGLVCNAVVDYADITAYFADGQFRVHAYRATASVIDGGQGDSGGPVVSLPGHVNVEGIIDEANDFVNCINYSSIRGDVCTKKVWYIDFVAQANVWGVVLKTN
jgi:hypothetical protein